MSQFTENNLVLSASAPCLPYASSKGMVKHSKHWGQLKLLISEIEFLTYYWNSQPNCKIVYVGAAPGSHIFVLNKLFPDFEYHLYDTEEFDARLLSQQNVIIHPKLFDATDVQFWKTSTDKIYLISDIRNLEYNKYTTTELSKKLEATSNSEERRQLKEEILQTQRLTEELCMSDMRLQESWVNEINPVKALLKFRLPWAFEFMLNSIPTFRYLGGTILLQSWEGQTSTETRLVPSNEQIDWDYKKYEEQMRYHNLITRLNVQYAVNKDLAGLHLSNNFDSAATEFIISKYLEKINQPINSKNIVELLRAIITNITDTGVNLLE